MLGLRWSGQISYPALSGGALATALAVCEAGPASAPKPRLLDRVRHAIGARHYSRRTEKAYVHWIKRYIFFHGKRHPVEMGAAEVTEFLTSLAVHGKVAASTQNQALSALLFLYREVLSVELPWLDGLVRAKPPQRLPVVLTREEVRTVLGKLDGVPRLMAFLLYGAGLRLLECCRLRVKDVDFGTNLRGTAHRPAAPSPPPRIRSPAGSEGRGPERRHRQAGHVPHLPTLVRHPPAGGQPRHPDGSGVARPPGCDHDHDLHPRSQPRPAGVRSPADRMFLS